MDINDLRDLLIDCAGEDETNPVSVASLDVPFEELGYDSLAMMEMTARITQTYGIRIPESRIDDLQTPRAVLDLVNQTIAA